MPQVSIPCATCGKTFESFPSNDRRYCSRTCYDHATSIPATCNQCSKTIRLSPSKQKHKRHYCSKACFDAVRKQWVTVACFRCGKIIQRTPYQLSKRKRIYCSPECYRPTQMIPCANCGKTVQKPPSEVKAATVHYCSQACHYDHRAKPLEQRFWDNVAIAEPDQCWLWQGYIRPNGYGELQADHRQKITAHRLSYILANHAIPEGLYVRHKCDMPACVNPNHLELGLPEANSADMVFRNRSLPGSRNPNSKLTADDVQTIRLLAKTMPQKEIARAFKLSKGNVSQIVSRKTWKHIQ